MVDEFCKEFYFSVLGDACRSQEKLAITHFIDYPFSKGECWFYGFKLHLIINDKGEILSFVVTPANIDDRQPLKNRKFVEKIGHKLYADKGYIDKKLVELLFIDGIHLITGIRNNMKIHLWNYRA